MYRLRASHLTLCFSLFLGASYYLSAYEDDLLPSWNEGPAKRAIVSFVHRTTNQHSRDYVEPRDRIALFDQDGTLCVERPLCAHHAYSCERLKLLAADNPSLCSRDPFKTAVSSTPAALSKLSPQDFQQIMNVVLNNIPLETFNNHVQQWIAKAKHPRWNRFYSELTYKPMLELLSYLRHHDYRTYLMAMESQPFTRAYAQDLYGIFLEQVIGTTNMAYEDSQTRKSLLIKAPLNIQKENAIGVIESIHGALGKRPLAAFGNAFEDLPMLEYTQGRSGASLMLLVLHDDAEREYAYGPQSNHNRNSSKEAWLAEAEKNDWVVVSMKHDWKQIFNFEE